MLLTQPIVKLAIKNEGGEYMKLSYKTKFFLAIVAVAVVLVALGFIPRPSGGY